MGAPDIAEELRQHAAYVEALERAGVRVIRLSPDPAHPDSTFVEDTAVIAGSVAVLTRPGAESRRGEVASIGGVLQALAPRLRAIEAPGTVDGGDVLEAGDRVIIGISERTNEEGARQLAAILADGGIASTPLDIRGIPGLLHLKTGISWLGDRRVLAVPALEPRARALGLAVVPVPEEESYAANCVAVNGRLLVPAGFRRTGASLRELGYTLIPLEMSEFRKMDGGLSCLSLRLPLNA